LRVVVQIGYQKSRGRNREGQLVSAWVNDVPCSWSDSMNEGKWLTSPAKGIMGNSWYLWAGDVGENDVIRVEVKTSLTGFGPDERRTFNAFYVVSSSLPVREIVVPGVGMKRFPLIKGRIKEVGSVSAEDERIAAADDFLDEDKF
jgi:hypothetical protein